MTEEIDEIYRRASALDRGRPSEAVRRKVLAHAAQLAASPHRASPLRAGPRSRRRSVLVGTLAAAALAGLLVVPRLFNPAPVPAGIAPLIESANTAAPPLAGAPPLEDAPAAPAADGSPPQARRRAAPTSSARGASDRGAPRFETAAKSAAAVAAGASASAGAGAAGDAAAGAPPDREAESPPADPAAALRRAAETGDMPALREILAGPVRIDAPDSRGRSALLLAVLAGRTDSVEMLLAHGADPNAADGRGLTPLQAAAGRSALVSALRRAGAH